MLFDVIQRDVVQVQVLVVELGEAQQAKRRCDAVPVCNAD